jgi:single-strand DNA-binding protein
VAINNVTLTGFLGATPELKYSTSGVGYTRVNLSVSRPKKKEQEKADTDWIPILAFGKRAEVIAQYFEKGSQIGIEGHIQTGSYEKDGVKHYTFEIVVDNFHFLDRKAKSENKSPSESGSTNPFDNLDLNDDIPW